MGIDDNKSTTMTPANAPIEDFLRNFVSSMGVGALGIGTSTQHFHSAKTPTESSFKIMQSSSKVQQKASKTINIKGSQIRNKIPSNAHFSKASINTHLTLDDSINSTMDSDEKAFDAVGKSEIKKIKQIRKQQTFAFSLAATGGDDTEEEEEDDDKPAELETAQRKASQVAAKAKKSRRKNIISFELNKEAVNRANQEKASQKRNIWKKNIQKK